MTLSSPPLRPVAALIEIVPEGTDATLFGEELDSVASCLEDRGLPVTRFTAATRDAVFSQADLSESFVFAGLSSAWDWAGRVGCRDQVLESYPSALRGLLNRDIWVGPVTGPPPCVGVERVFVKPMRPCFFDGHRVDAELVAPGAAASVFEARIGDAPCLWSAPVGWVSEYRCYVLDGRVVGLCPYRFLDVTGLRLDLSQVEAEIPQVRPEPEFLAHAIEALGQGGAPVAYALDVGLMAHGEMSLVEANDALSLSNYGIGVEVFVDLHLARWWEMTAHLRSGM